MTVRSHPGSRPPHLTASMCVLLYLSSSLPLLGASQETYSPSFGLLCFIYFFFYLTLIITTTQGYGRHGNPHSQKSYRPREQNGQQKDWVCVWGTDGSVKNGYG